MFSLHLETRNAAFEDDGPAEVARILHDIATRLEQGEGFGDWPWMLRDINGNAVGHCVFVADRD